MVTHLNRLALSITPVSAETIVFHKEVEEGEGQECITISRMQSGSFKTGTNTRSFNKPVLNFGQHSFFVVNSAAAAKPKNYEPEEGEEQQHHCIMFCVPYTSIRSVHCK